MEEEIQKYFESFSTALLRDLNKNCEKLKNYFFRNYRIPKNVKKRGNMPAKINELYKEIVSSESFNDKKREEISQIEVREYELELERKS